MKREVFVGGVGLGGRHPVRIQSMTNTKTEDVEATVQQILALEDLGCEMVRVSIPHEEAARAIPAIKNRIHIPLIADIHFNQSLALLAMKEGADKIRINPGNMPRTMLDAIIEMAGEKGIPIRIGVNSGSVERDLLREGLTAEAMVSSLSRTLRYFEDRHFFDLVLAAKASRVPLNVEVNEMLHQRFDYPLHLGVTEAGLGEDAIVKSAMGIGSLLLQGIGATIRVSVTGSPLQEMALAKRILQTAELRKGLNLISCPTCARCHLNLEEMVSEVKERLGGTDPPLDIAIMGCVVNGPGEAREADLGLAGGKEEALLFRRGEILGKYPAAEIVDRLMDEIRKMGY